MVKHEGRNVINNLSSIRLSDEAILADRQCFNLNPSTLALLMNKLLSESHYRENARHLATLLRNDGGTHRAVQLINQWIVTYNNEDYNYTSTIRQMNSWLSNDRYLYHQTLAMELMNHNNMLIIVPLAAVIITIILIIGISRMCCKCSGWCKNRNIKKHHHFD
jgi:hypothetical protein